MRTPCAMTDSEIKAKLQQVAQFLTLMLPGRAYCLFIFPSKDGEEFHYVANCQRDQVVAAMKEIAGKPAAINLPKGENN